MLLQRLWPILDQNKKLVSKNASVLFLTNLKSDRISLGDSNRGLSNQGLLDRTTEPPTRPTLMVLLGSRRAQFFGQIRFFHTRRTIFRVLSKMSSGICSTFFSLSGRKWTKKLFCGWVVIFSFVLFLRCFFIPSIVIRHFSWKLFLKGSFRRSLTSFDEVFKLWIFYLF